MLSRSPPEHACLTRCLDTPARHRSKAVVGQPSCFHVESFDEYGNLTSASLTDALPILITMSNGGIECPVTITPMSSQGVYMCEYTVEVSFSLRTSPAPSHQIAWQLFLHSHVFVHLGD
jgi:hypothetical protein